MTDNCTAPHTALQKGRDTSKDKIEAILVVIGRRRGPPRDALTTSLMLGMDLLNWLPVGAQHRLAKHPYSAAVYSADLRREAEKV
ncbi:hypothetical protein Ct61P_06228 [Colletotrichum tofieldiae]|uniref:Uncharacterized protein n=1 Tax=Colletotrichum liriopes TaxID=708192 RepID=A0AA37H198_9PEZI|nr:hypothetical protein ColLi_13983 [Colletotrichum liriopes]GKT88378.1 hypothetical protein Ct61P_06228 [Colletotrichum tofieldiae]